MTDEQHEAERARSAEYYRANRDEVAARNLRWRRANPEKAQALKIRWRRENEAHHRAVRAELLARTKERRKALAKAWRDANPERVKIAGQNRSRRAKGNPQSVGVSLRDWERMLRRYAGCCHYCAGRFEKLEMDHVIPISRGGRHSIGNVVPACMLCNRRKHARLISEWRLRQIRSQSAA